MSELFDVYLEKAKEQKIEVPNETSVSEKIKAICKEQLDVSCSVSISKKKGKLERDLVIKVSKFLTETELRNLMGAISNLSEIKLIDHFEAPNKVDPKKPSMIIATLEK